MQENKLGVMPIRKLIWNMSLPIMASMLVQALYNIVDSVFVAMVNEQSLTAVSLAFPAQQLMIGLATGTAVGVNALMGRALGAKQQEKANKVACNGVFLAVDGFALCALLAAIFARPFFAAQTSIDYIVEQGTSYLLIACCCSFGLFGEIIFERLLQGTGRSIYSMYSQGLGAIINIILDPVFIFVFKMGVTGAAVATVLGQICGCIFSFYLNRKKNPDIHLSFRRFRPDWKIVGGIYAIGIPSVIMMAIGSVMVFLMNKILIAYHSAAETAATVFGVYFKLNSFIFMPIFGMNNGVVPIVAYNYGAQNRSRMTETIKRSTLYASCIMIVGMGVFLSIPDTLLKLFSASDTMLAIGAPALRIISLSFCMAGACIALGSSFQALGRATYSMIISFIRQLIFLIPVAYVLARLGQQVGNDNLVWWSYPIAEVFSLVVTLLCYNRLFRTVISKIPLHGPDSTPPAPSDAPRQD
ncbi:MAG: MATE family efflux transporter [Clostridiales bacterium]|nr:MATE family efflux transporter [Clostridiales bacterium]